MFGLGQRPQAAEAQAGGPVDLLSLFRRGQGVPAPTITAHVRGSWRAAAVRPSPQVFSEINQSAWQPVNVPALTQVDIAPEYMPPWPLMGEVNYLEYQGYSQNPLYGQMIPRPQLPYSLATPPYQTLPWMVTPQGTYG